MEDTVNWPSMLKTLAKYAMILYLVNHGVSLPADSKVAPLELATAFYYASLGWILNLVGRQL
jgi:hypothetical protein